MAKEQYRVNVLDESENVVARVRYNSCLDYWDGRNWTNGGVGRHLGLTKLKDGRYALIYGTQWQGEKDYGKIVTPERALQEILKSGNSDLLNTKKYAELNALYEKNVTEEEEDDE